jgi:hypothetical protein
MEAQGTASAAALSNQRQYVELLQQEAALLQTQADAAVSKDQAKQGKDRADAAAKAEEAQNKEAEAEQRGLDKRLHIEEEYYKKSQEMKKRAAEDKQKDDEIALRADEAFTHEIQEQDAERNKIAQDLGKEEADTTRKMAERKYQAAEEAIKQMEKLGQMHGQAVVDAEVKAQNDVYKAQMQAYQLEIGALDKNSKDYEVKLKAMQDRELELTRDHETKLTQIVTQAEEERKQKVIQAENQMGNVAAETAAKSIIQGKNMEQAFERVGGQMMQTALTNLLQIETVQGRKRLGDARTAAADAFESAGNPILGGIEAAGAFAAVMAFASGGIVPGVEKNDVVPAMLTPGEAVLPKNLVDNLKQSGGAPQNGDTHIHRHYHEYHMHAIDGPSVERMLEKHADKFEKHAESHFRKKGM